MPANKLLFDRLRCALLACLPHHALSRVVYRLTRLRSRVHVPVTRGFIRLYGVNMSEAETGDPAAFTHFNAFFTRALREGARPQQGDEDTLTAPVDGRVSRLGTVDGDRVIQAKGIDYSLTTLLGGDRELARTFDGHAFATLYLAPGDYHRIHMPLAGRLQRMIYVPGRLYSVADWRVCCLFETAHGPLGLVLVGAINVAAIETAWAGLITPPRGRDIARWAYDAATAPVLQRGEEMGRFNMGSTVIVLAPTGYEWNDPRPPGTVVRLGEVLALPRPAAATEQVA